VSPPNDDDEAVSTPATAGLEVQLEQMRLELSSIRSILEQRGTDPTTL
jgi:hypothetical protein